MARTIDAKIDALFVEGPDDGAVVNAFVRKVTGVDLSHRSTRLVRTNEAGGGDAWALRQFDEYIPTAREGARIGVIVDRDTPRPAPSAGQRGKMDTVKKGRRTVRAGDFIPRSAPGPHPSRHSSRAKREVIRRQAGSRFGVALRCNAL